MKEKWKLKQWSNKKCAVAAALLAWIAVWEQDRLNVFTVTSPSALCINVILFGAISYMGYCYLFKYRKIGFILLFSAFTAFLLCLGILFRMIADILLIHYLRTIVSAICLTPAVAFIISKGLEGLSRIQGCGGVLTKESISGDALELSF